MSYQCELDNEIWRDNPRFPNHQVSSKGRVKNKKTGHILKSMLNKDGYPVLSIGSVDNVPIHRLVMETFVGKPSDGRNQVNHIDCDRQNNDLSNLEWCTASENIKWGITHGRIDPMVGLRRAAEVNPKPVRLRETGQTFLSVKSCAEFLGVPATNISRVLTGVRKGQSIHGYHVEYVDKEVR